jgi:hypothetical protein
MEVQFKDIKVGETYGIKWNRHVMNEKYIGKCLSHSGSSGIFKIKIKYYYNNEHRSMDNETIYYDELGYSYFLLGQKETIQNAMEKRALNEILEKIVGHTINI